MPPDSFVAVVDKLWQQVRPSTLQLHAYVRADSWRAWSRAGPANGMLAGAAARQHVGQELETHPDIVLPPVAPGTKRRFTALFEGAQSIPASNVPHGRAVLHVRSASIRCRRRSGTVPVQPAARPESCATRARGTSTNLTDLRVKMCTEPTGKISVPSTRAGHDFYFRSYKISRFLYQNGADDASRSDRDAIALSVTPRYLLQIGTAGFRAGSRG